MIVRRSDSSWEVTGYNFWEIDRITTLILIKLVWVKIGSKVHRDDKRDRGAIAKSRRAEWFCCGFFDSNWKIVRFGGGAMMCSSPWISTWNQLRMEIRTFWTIQTRFIHPTVPIRLTEPCTGSTCVRPEWSFGWNHDQTTELTVPELVFPDHLDILRTIVEPDLAWVVKNLKTDMDSHLADHPDSAAGVLIVTAVHLSGSDESGQ